MFAFAFFSLLGAALARDVAHDAFALTADERAALELTAPPGLSFSGVFGDEMVLQQNAEAAVFGVITDDAGEAVTVTLTDEASGAATTRAATVERDAGGRAVWRAVLPAGAGVAGGNYTLAAACADCASARAVALRNVTFGEVWLCAGQSNAWLVTYYAFERNETYARARAGDFGHVRLRTQARANVSDAARAWVAPPAPPYDPVGGFPGGGWLRATGGDEDVENTIAQFSAACWFFAAALGDAERARRADAGEPERPLTPIGLVGSYWGGTTIEMWTPNATLYDSCTNTTGGPPDQRDDYANGALFNGMVAPWVNSSLAGVIWYQGENNVGQCVDDARADDASGQASPAACGARGDAAGGGPKGAGYACMIEALVRGWRAAWRAPELPFGIVTLAAGTSEGHSTSMGAFRHAQTAGCGALPCAALPRTFAALAHDLGDPWTGAGARCAERDAPWACQRDADNSNDGPFTKFFMGAIHPRAKPALGRRLALGARAVAYDEPGLVFSGPVARACTVVDGGAGGVRVDFDAARLGDADAVRVWKAGLAVEDTDALLARCGDLGAPACSSFGYTSPMEVQYDGRVRARARARARRVSPILAVVRFDATRVV